MVHTQWTDVHVRPESEGSHLRRSMVRARGEMCAAGGGIGWMVCNSAAVIVYIHTYIHTIDYN